jgi:Leucine-rich repeat (LRR) protein
LEIQIKTAVMKYLLVFACMFLWIFSAGQNTQSPEQIRQEMARIRQTTNWDDPAAAKKANEQIRELSKKLMAGNQMPAGGGANQQQQGGNTSSKDAQKLNELNQEMLDQKMDIWTQIWKSAAGGEGADILLAEPLRKEIVQEFKDDESPTGLSSEYLNEKNFLIIDMSLPNAKILIDQMENFKSIKILVITGGSSGAMVNLNDLLTKAAGYPLNELYIINFRHFVKTIPQKIENFNQLRLLALFNNDIEKLPPSIGALTSLKILYVDINPLITLEPVINSLTQLDTLGIAKTKIPQEELKRISQLHINCKILEQ